MLDEAPSPVPPDRVAAVRRFNRFHTRLVGALNERLLASEYALAEARVLYELANAGAEPSAAELGRALGMDAGYLSRLLGRLEAAGLVARASTPDHGRRLALSLTERGREAFAGLDAASVAEVAALLAPLGEADQAALVAAMARIERLLGGAVSDGPILLRDPRPGDLGLVVSRQGALYAREYGWDWTFEALVAEIVGGFVQAFVPGRERCWIAEIDGQIAGSVFNVRASDEVAKLRLLYVEPWARGRGLGRRLVDECLAFARGAGYRRMELWTNDVLVAARRIYQAAGFELVEEAPHRSFGHDLVGQNWARDL